MNNFYYLSYYDYYEDYTTGWIIGIIIAVVGFVIYLAYKAGSTVSSEQLWQNRVKVVEQKKNNFYNHLKTQEFNIDYKITTEAFYRTPTRIEIFSMCFNYAKKQIAFASYEEEDNKIYILNFSDIARFEILNGISNTTMSSFGSGAAIGSHGLSSGVVSSESYQETTIEKIKLKIETTNPYSPAIIVMMSNFRVDVGSETYQLLLNACEQIKTSLGRIVAENNK